MGKWLDRFRGEKQQPVPMGDSSMVPPPTTLSLPHEEFLPPLDRQFRKSRTTFLQLTRSSLADLQAIQLHKNPRADDASGAREAYDREVEAMTDEELARATRTRVREVVHTLINFSFAIKDSQTTDQETFMMRDRVYGLTRYIFRFLDCPQDVTEAEAAAVMVHRVIPDITQNTSGFPDAIQFIHGTLAGTPCLHDLMTGNDDINGQVNEALSSISLVHPETLTLPIASDLMEIYLIIANHDISMQNTNVAGLEKLFLGGIEALRKLPKYDSMASHFTYRLKDSLAALTASFLRNGNIDAIARLVSTINTLTGAVQPDEQEIIKAGDATRGEGYQRTLVTRYYESLLYNIARSLKKLSPEQQITLRGLI